MKRATTWLAASLAGVAVGTMIAATAHAGSRPTMPKAFHGNWCATTDPSNKAIYERKDCRETGGTLTVTAKGYEETKSGCELLAITPLPLRTGNLYTFQCSGEGYISHITQTMQLIGGGLFTTVIEMKS
jgi:hypothetical protein